MLRGYQVIWLRHDIMAGLVLTTMLIPVGVAYAVGSGVTGLNAHATENRWTRESGQRTRKLNKDGTKPLWIGEIHETIGNELSRSSAA